MRINEFTSLGLSRQLANSQKAIARSLERLSSGKRVSSASDDLSSFSRIEGLDAQIRGLSQATQNINLGAGLVDTAISAVSTQTDIVQRMREIAVQAANGLLSDRDREALNEELTALRDEFSRIATNTQFGDQSLFNGDSIEFQIGDGINDQITLDLPSLQTNDVFTKNIGTGDFFEAESLGDLSTSASLAADFDNDGDIDLLDITSSQFRTYKNDGDANFSLSHQSANSGGSNGSLGDFNGDGFTDIFLLGPDDGRVQIYLNNGDGQFSLDQELLTGGDSYTSPFIVNDFNNDGKDDIALRSKATGDLKIYTSTSSGSFVESEIEVFSDPSFLQTGDFNNDGNIDILSAATEGYNVLLGDGAGSFSSAGTIEISNSELFTQVGDFNNDGVLDFVATGTRRTLTSFLGDGSGGFTEASTFDFGLNNYIALTSGDYNGDGNLDFISLNVSGTQSLMFLGNGDGSFTNSGQIESRGFASADLNGDGALDYLGTDSEIRLFLNRPEEVSAVADVNVLTQNSAQNLIDILDNSLNELLQASTELGAFRNRLEIASNSNLLTVESLTEAQLNIENADFAQETAELVSAQILQQAQIASLSQANLQMQMVLGLLFN